MQTRVPRSRGNIEDKRARGQRNVFEGRGDVADIRKDVAGSVATTLPCELLLRSTLDFIEWHGREDGAKCAI